MAKIKRLLKLAITFGLLVAGLAGYRVGFAVISARVSLSDGVPLIPFNATPARTARETMKLAREAFGPNHWTTDFKNTNTYYDVQGGYWLFWRTSDRTKGGKSLQFKPFAAIWRSKDKNNLNTVLGNEASVDFDRPFDLGKSDTESAKVVHAQLDGEVRIRDDKGTRDNPGDDLTIGPFVSLQYDAINQQVLSDSDFELREKDLVVTATKLVMDLWPTPPDAKGKTGFTGVKTVRLGDQKHKVRIAVDDVGRGGVVPGGIESTQPRPGELLCDGEARFDLPRPRPKDAPPAPPAPVLAHFSTNVVVREAHAPVNGVIPPPDQLNADLLRLTLLPKEGEEDSSGKARKAEGAPDQKASGSSSASTGLLDMDNGLVLKVAEATGHAVWLQSPAQGLEARGNQLLVEKNAPQQPDRIYFRGDKETRIEKTSFTGQDAGVPQISSIDTIHTIDVTIYQPLKPGEESTIIARGPGFMETRAGRGQPVERSAIWNDRLEVQNVPTPVGERKKVKLTGTPRIESTTQGTITAQDQIVAYLKPKNDKSATDKPAAKNDPSSTLLAPGANDPLQIDWFEASNDVHLTTHQASPGQGNGPRGQQMIHVRKNLSAVFEVAQNDAAAIKDASPATADPKDAPRSEPEGEKSGQKAAGPDNRTADSQDPAAPTPKPPTPPLEVEADFVWARLAMTGAKDNRTDIKEGRLRGNSRVHQDPLPGKSKGTNATGEKIDIVAQDERWCRDNESWLRANGPRTLPPPSTPVTYHIESLGTNRTLTRIEMDTFAIEGPKVICDQLIDFAKVEGPGRLTQEARPALAPDQAERDIKKTVFYDGDKTVARAERPARDAERLGGNGPVDITWKEKFEFHGRSDDELARGNAMALFVGEVRVVTSDSSSGSSLRCSDRMKAFFDGPVAFQIPAAGQARPPQPHMVLLHAMKDVDLIHRKVDPESNALLQKARIMGPFLSYNLESGEFQGDGPGDVRLYRPKGKNPLQVKPSDPARDRTATAPTVRQTGYIPRPEQPTSSRKAPTGSGLDLTRVSFLKDVSGRVGTGGSSSEPQALRGAPFVAVFKGGVQVIDGPVLTERSDLLPDDPPDSAMVLASQELKVVREAPPAAPSDGEPPPEKLFIDATGDPQAIAPPKAIKGDRITYDSINELFYVYGLDGGVTIVNQDGLGQPYSATRGQALMYNRRTSEVKMIDPRNALIVDPRSGIRATPVAPGQIGATKPAKPPRPPRMVTPNDKERRGFSGH